MSDPVFNMAMNGQPIHLKLIRNTKGYQWEITVDAESAEEALALINDLDTQLKKTYAGEKDEQ
jgi:hypothetical protein